MFAILLAKPSMPGTMSWNLQQHMCIFAIVKYWGNVRWMISVLLKFIFVSVLIEIQALTHVQMVLPYHIHKRGGDMFPLPNYTGHIYYCFLYLHLHIDAYYSVNQSILKAPDLSGDGGSI